MYQILHTYQQIFEEEPCIFNFRCQRSRSQCQDHYLKTRIYRTLHCSEAHQTAWPLKEITFTFFANLVHQMHNFAKHPLKDIHAHYWQGYWPHSVHPCCVQRIFWDAVCAWNFADSNVHQNTLISLHINIIPCRCGWVYLCLLFYYFLFFFVEDIIWTWISICLKDKEYWEM